MTTLATQMTDATLHTRMMSYANDLFRKQNARAKRFKRLYEAALTTWDPNTRIHGYECPFPVFKEKDIRPYDEVSDYYHDDPEHYPRSALFENHEVSTIDRLDRCVRAQRLRATRDERRKRNQEEPEEQPKESDEQGEQCARCSQHGGEMGVLCQYLKEPVTVQYDGANHTTDRVLTCHYDSAFDTDYYLFIGPDEEWPGLPQPLEGPSAQLCTDCICDMILKGHAYLIMTDVL